MERKNEEVGKGGRKWNKEIEDVFGRVNFLLVVWKRKEVFYPNFGDEGLSFFPRTLWMCV